MSVFKLAAFCLIALVCGTVTSYAAKPQTGHQAGIDEPTVVTGVLASRNPTSLKNKTGYDAVIVDIVPDRSWVSKGDVVIQLDDSFLEQKRQEQRIEIQAVQTEIEKRERRLSTSVSELEAEIEIARKQKEVAELDHNRIFGENGKLKRAITRQQQLLDLSIKRKRLAEQRREQSANDEQGSLATQELELEIESFEKEIQYRENELQSLRGPESEYQKSALELATFEATNRVEVLTSKLDLLRDSAQSEIQIIQQTLEREFEKLKTLESQLAACLIRAPKDGMFYYSKHRNDDFIIELGETVRDFEQIALIPNMEQLQIEVRLNEAQVALAKIGQRATIKFRNQDQSFPGAIFKIDDFPEPHSWQNKERLYRVYISVDDHPKDLELGAEARVTLLNQS